MTNMNEIRLEATTRVMKALARLTARESLPVRLEDGHSPIVVSLPEDTVVDLVARVERAGGDANVVVAYPEFFAIAAFTGEYRSENIDDVATVHHLSNVDMLLTWLRSTPDNSGSIRVDDPSDCENTASDPVVREHEYAF